MAQPPPPESAGYGLASRIRATLPHLPGSMARVGRLLLDEPGLLIEASINEVARRASVSPATVTRFARQIGYTGFLALRVAAAADAAREDVQGVWDRAQGDVESETSPRGVLRALLAHNLRALQSSAELIDQPALGRIADAIVASDRVDIYGIATSGLVAQVAASHLYQIGINARAWTELQTGLASGSLLTPRSVAIGVSNTGRNRDTIELLSLARTRGALTVAVSSDSTSPLVERADIHIQTYHAVDTLTTAGMAAKYGQMVVFDAIYVLVAQHDQAQTEATLEASWQAVSAFRPVQVHRRRRG
jgi:DNA-binding MurR/RpiR family transcriptional regulator